MTPKVNPERVKEILLDLCSVKSVSDSDQENEGARRIFRILSGLKAFSKPDSALKLLDCGGKEALLAYMPGSSKDTVGLTGHFDVVSPGVYRDLEPLAFDPLALTKALKSRSLPEDARKDLDGGWLFGRGAADMKCGLSVFMALMEKWDETEMPFGALFLAVPDEENLSLGMRESLKEVSEFIKDRGINLLAWINGEPTFKGDGRIWPVYRGSVGKVMGFVLSVGVSAHGGEFFKGLSAVQIASQINGRLEGSPVSSELVGDKWLPPGSCVGFEAIRDGYSVTLFDRVMARYNMLYWNRTLQDLLDVLKKSALEGLAGAMDMTSWAGRKMGQAFEVKAPRVLTLQELLEFSGKVPILKDRSSLANQASSFVLRALDKSGLQGPLAVVGFLPPWYPPSVPGDSKKEEKLDKALEALFALGKSKGLCPVREDIFEGISDLSYLWPKQDESSLDFMAKNMAAWGDLYSVPLDQAEFSRAPVCNIGPLGRDIHKATERLEPEFAFKVLPELLEGFIENLCLGK